MVASSTTAIDTFIASIGSIIWEVVPEILLLLAGLVGLGWGIRKFMKWVSGRKF